MKSSTPEAKCADGVFQMQPVTYFFLTAIWLFHDQFQTSRGHNTNSMLMLNVVGSRTTANFYYLLFKKYIKVRINMKTEHETTFETS